MVVKALSIRQPWASPIIGNVPGVPRKDVENRTWSTNYRGRLYIHAAKTFDNDGYEYMQREMGFKLPPKDWFPRGGIIGRVDLVDCVNYHESEWFAGELAFVLENPEPVDFIPMSGQLNIFNVNIDEGPASLPAGTAVANMRDKVLVTAAKAAGRFVYIGRPSGSKPWGFGNPFASEPGTRAAKVVDNPMTAYDSWLNGTAHQEVLPAVRGWQLANIPNLRGKILLCWCKPNDCHGDIIKRRAEGG